MDGNDEIEHGFPLEFSPPESPGFLIHIRP